MQQKTTKISQETATSKTVNKEIDENVVGKVTATTLLPLKEEKPIKMRKIIGSLVSAYLV